MPLLPDGASRLETALAGRYRIERELGAGGMATVYLAEDARHKRFVALKVLHPELSAVLGPERFLKEIELTASLQHPHILPLFDSGEADGQLYYVMPLVDGDTLRARLDRERQLPIADAVRIASEVADALQFAHEHGVIHRDVKPENILLQGGHALVADFGIALAVQQASGVRMTQTGLSLGTPQYMAPEQAMGEKTIDARADVYALGAVTYEMLAGEPPFTGPSLQAVVARVMTEEPRGLIAQRKAVPPAVEQAVLRALEKLPADRFASASAFVAALRAETVASPYAKTHAGTRASAQGARAWRLTAALACVTVASLTVAAWALTRRAAVAPAIVFDAALPDEAPLSSSNAAGASGFGDIRGGISISPDGAFVVYSAPQGDSTVLWYRSLVDASAHAIPGTAGGAAPAISPDGARLAFVAGDRTELVPIAGGTPRRLMDGDAPSTLQWVSPSRLMAISNQGFTLNWIDPEVGVVDKLPLGSRNARCYFGQWLADERKLLCGFYETATIVDPATGATTPVRHRAPDGKPGEIVSGAAFRLVDGRYLTFLALDGTLRAAAYDRETHLLGRVVTLASAIDRDIVGRASIDLAPNGTLGYAPTSGAAAAQMVVQHATGEPVALPVEAAAYVRFDLSRDRRRLAAVVVTAEGTELRVIDLRTGRQQTWLRGTDIKMPLWSPRGDRVVVHVANAAGAALLIGSPDATTPPDTLASGPVGQPVFDAVEFVDDTTLLARAAGSPMSFRLHLGTRPVRVDTLLRESSFATVSPDARHLAWHVGETNQLFVSSYPPGGRRQLIATSAVEPLWLSPTTLLYRSSVTWYAAQIDAATGELTGPPTVWRRDTRFLDTPGWSNRLSWDGGIVYARSPVTRDARWLRFVPDFVSRMKRAVDEANR